MWAAFTTYCLDIAAAQSVGTRIIGLRDGSRSTRQADLFDISAHDSHEGGIVRAAPALTHRATMAMTCR